MIGVHEKKNKTARFMHPILCSNDNCQSTVLPTLPCLFQIGFSIVII